MALSVVDLYRDVLPKTNCKDCGYLSCMAFASMVVSEKLPLKNCPHIDPDILKRCEKELEAQYAEGKWLKKDLARDALLWAKERAASMKIKDLPDRIGGEIKKDSQGDFLKLPYFNDFILIHEGKILKKDGSNLNRWEQVFVYNHVAQGGSALPTGKWKGLVEIPNTVSKVKSMKSHVEEPLIERFSGKIDELKAAAKAIGGIEVRENAPSADIAMLFQPLPKIPVMLLFWEGNQTDGFGAEAKLLFDETIVEHLDIESIMFLSERLRQLLCGEE